MIAFDALSGTKRGRAGCARLQKKARPAPIAGARFCSCLHTRPTGFGETAPIMSEQGQGKHAWLWVGRR